jgi:Lrp/AsnC family leucine-responsive transcriptional regulator
MGRYSNAAFCKAKSLFHMEQTRCYLLSSDGGKAIVIKRLRYEDGPIDALDARILRALADDARISVAEIARLVGLSGPSVSERIRRLEESGVIEGYTVRINAPGVGLPIAAWLRVRPLPGELARVADILRDLPEVAECDRITGDDCFIAKAHVRSMEHLEEIIDRIIPFAMTNTSIIQSSPVGRRLPAFGAGEIEKPAPTRKPRGA